MTFKYLLTISSFLFVICACQSVSTLHSTPSQPTNTALSIIFTPTTSPTKTSTPLPSSTTTPTTVKASPTLSPTYTPTPIPTIMLSSTLKNLVETDVATRYKTLIETQGQAITGVEVFPIPNQPQPLWGAFTKGNTYQTPEQAHIVALYTLLNGTWQQVTEATIFEMSSIFSVKTVEIEPTQLWLAVNGVLSPGSTYRLLQFNGKKLHLAFSVDLDDTDINFIDLDQDDIKEITYRSPIPYQQGPSPCSLLSTKQYLHRWDGSQFKNVTLSPLPNTTPAEQQVLNETAIALAEAHLLEAAEETIEQALHLDEQNQVLKWNAQLIHLLAQTHLTPEDGEFPLFYHLFYGDYPAILDLMRSYSAAETFNPQTSLIKDITEPPFRRCDPFQEIIDLTTTTLTIQPNLASAYFLRAWATYQTNANSPTILADIQQAVDLNPNEPLFNESLQFILHQ